MFIARSCFVVANGMEHQVAEAFRRRPHAVDAAPGFVRMEVTCPVDRPEEFSLTTYWSDEQSFRAWYKSHNLRASHALMPRGLKLVRGATELRLFTLVAE